MREENGLKKSFFFFSRRPSWPASTASLFFFFFKPRRGTFHNLQQIVIRRAGGMSGLSLSFFALRHLLLFLGITQQSTSSWIKLCQRDCIIIIQPLTLVRGRRAREGNPLSNSSASSACEPHEIIPLRASATVGPEPWEADGCPSFLEKRDRRKRSFLIEKNSQCTHIAPSRTSRACSSPKQKTQRSCVSSGVK